MQTNKLTDYSLLQISGNNAEKFLQGQLTCDVSKVTDTHTSFGAHCNAKGRMLSFFRLFKIEQDYYLLMPTDVIEIAKQHLHRYAVFSKVKVEILPLSTVILPFEFDPASAYENDVKHGIPRLYPNTIAEFLPHYLNLPQLDAVSFSKGCYTGQEIIARMEHRGKLKQHLYTLQLTENFQPGDKVIYCDETLGTCVDSLALEDNHYLLLVTMQDAMAEKFKDLIYSNCT